MTTPDHHPVTPFSSGEGRSRLGFVETIDGDARKVQAVPLGTHAPEKKE